MPLVPLAMVPGAASESNDTECPAKSVVAFARLFKFVLVAGYDAYYTPKTQLGPSICQHLVLEAPSMKETIA